jgi:L-aminopeptidase/D-esterase-like protein
MTTGEPDITDVAGVRVGHWTDQEAGTGCTVVLLPEAGAPAGVDVRGSAPGTRETDLLRPGMLVEQVHAITLCGGSAFGLAAADGVMRFLRERDIGLDVGETKVPLVPAAVVNDLRVGDATAYPASDQGYLAAVAAEREGPFEHGLVGAGTGCTVGNLLGEEHRSPGGLGSAAVRLPSGATVGALAVVNPLGDVVDDHGDVLAGAVDHAGRPIGCNRVLLTGTLPAEPLAGGNTTLVVVATDAALTKSLCRKLAEIGHDGMALAIRPVHTMFDGDTVFAVSTGTEQADITSLGAATVEAVRRAIRRAVRRTVTPR